LSISVLNPQSLDAVPAPAFLVNADPNLAFPANADSGPDIQATADPYSSVTGTNLFQG
jgi:hypothetical protein